MITKKRTWHECVNKDILSIYNDVKEETKRLYPEYFDCDPEFYIDGSTTQLGHCSYTLRKDTLKTKWGFNTHFEHIRYEKAFIVLSKYVIDLELARRVLVHEFAHFVTPKEHHSYCWQMRAKKIGAKWGITCERLANTEDSELFHAAMPQKDGINKKDYVVRCTGCGRLVHRQRMCSIIEHPHLWKCGVCGSKFEKV